MKASSPESLLVETPCRLEAVRDAARSLRRFLADCGASPAELDDWELIIVEAGNNAVQYASGNRHEKSVRFLMNIWTDSVELSITDQNPRFEIPSETSLPTDDSESGRGLYIIHALTDSVRYLRGKTENVLVLRRNRADRTKKIEVAVEAVNAREPDLATTLDLMMEELSSCYESLSTIFRFTAEMGRADDTPRCAIAWLKELVKVTSMDWFVFRLRVEGGALELASTSLERNESLPVQLQTNGAVTEKSWEVTAAAEGREVWFDADSDKSSTEPLVAALGKNICGIAYPIHVGGKLLGILSIGRLAAKQEFTVGQINVVHTFADFMGLQLSNEKARQEAVKGKLIRRELQIAGDIQRSLLPKTLVGVPGFTLAGYCQSANAVGGDFYDVIHVGDDGVLFAIADVMGKGVPAAMFAAMFRSHLRACAEMMRAPSRLLAWLNCALFADLDSVDMFVTAQIAYLHLPSRSLTVTSAGHCPLLIADPGSGMVREVSGDGPPLGINSGAIFRSETVHLPAQARMLMITDGLIEALDRSGVPLGNEAVAELLKQETQERSNATLIRDHILALADRHRDGAEVTDDLTFIVLAEKSFPSSTPKSHS